MIAANPAGFDACLILNSLFCCLAVEEAGLWIALVWAHYGQTLRKGFFSYALGSGTVGVTPAMISYICKSFVKSYKKKSLVRKTESYKITKIEITLEIQWILKSYTYL